MRSIIYNGKDSYKDFGLIITDNIVRPSISAIYETYNVPERRGSLNIFQSYDDNKIPVNFGFKTLKNITTRKSRILNWLNSKNVTELIISDDKTIFYKVNKVSVTGFDGKNIKTFSCTFTVDPYVNLEEGKEIIEITRSTILCNSKATEESEPYIKIYGSGDITININNQSLALKSVNEYIEVDSKLKNCYKNVNGVITNCNNQMYSTFPVLDVGENNISWAGNISKIEIVPRWCCL